MTKIPRRDFLKIAAGTAGGVLVGRAMGLELLLNVQDPRGAYPYRGWETLYVDQLAFDYQGRTTHSVNCTGSCTWKGYVRNGILFKEEQFADYPLIDPSPGDPTTPVKLPVYNPRGCQKGANHKEYVYGAQRVKQPLIRVGARGGGQWRAATWAEALALIAQKVVDAIQLSGPDTVNFYAAIPAKHQITVAGGFRLSNLLGAVAMSFYDWYCDLPPGEPQTWGVQTDSCEAADWFNSKLIWLQGANLLETRIPDAHFFTEARANGTKIVAFYPEYAPTSIHADVYVPIKPGTDGALNMAVARHIMTSNLYDAAYVKRYTDLPLLVRDDTRKFLRASDLVAGGSPDQFYFWDAATAAPVAAPGCKGSTLPTLDYGAAVDPALLGAFVVRLADGTRVKVRPVFQLLLTRVQPFTAKAVAAITGVPATLVTQLATELAATKPARIIEGAGTNHYFHNDLINRSQILLVALTGNVGKPGGGFDHYVGQEKIWPEHGWIDLAFPKTRANQRFQNTTLWTYVHAGVQSEVDALYPRPLSSYIQESTDKWWMPLWPFGTLTNQRQPKVLFIWGANYVNQAKGSNALLNTLFPKLDLVVDLNFRMDTSANYADVVLPVASHYEKWDLNSTDLHSFIHPFTPVLDPQFESRTDWQVWRLLAAAIQAEATARGFTSFQDTQARPDGTPLFDVARNLGTLLADFDTLTPAGVLAAPGVANDKDACQYILDRAPETAGFTVDGIGGADYRVANPDPTRPSIVPPRSHPRRFVATSEAWTSEMKPGVAYYGFQRMIELFQPLTTLTGRQQFYIDHDWYVNEFDEALPTFKPTVDADLNPITGAVAPLRWITPHGRWSIHSTWRDAKYQLRMQRGRPICYLNPADAAARGLVDNDLVKMFNQHGSNLVHVCISNRIPPGMVQMYHGWERHTMGGILLEPTPGAAPNHGSWQAVTTIRINPTQLAGGYGQLTFRLNYWGPTGNQKDTLVEVVKA